MSPRGQRGVRSLWQIMRWPLLLGVVSVAGLVAALVGDGVLNVLSWLCLGGLLALIGYFLRR